MNRATTTTREAFALTTVKDESRADSRLLAVTMQKDHANLLELVRAHRADFEEFGKVRFETGAFHSCKACTAYLKNPEIAP